MEARRVRRHLSFGRYRESRSSRPRRCNATLRGRRIARMRSGRRQRVQPCSGPAGSRQTANTATGRLKMVRRTGGITKRGIGLAKHSAAQAPVYLQRIWEERMKGLFDPYEERI